MMPISDPEPAAEQEEPEESFTVKAGVKKENRDKEMQMVNDLIGNFLLNLEATVTNVVIRVNTAEVKS